MSVVASGVVKQNSLGKIILDTLVPIMAIHHVVYMTSDTNIRSPIQCTSVDTAPNERCPDLLLYVPDVSSKGQITVTVLAKFESSQNSLLWPEGATELVLCCGVLTVGAMRHLGVTTRLHSKTSMTAASAAGVSNTKGAPDVTAVVAKAQFAFQTQSAEDKCLLPLI